MSLKYSTLFFLKQISTQEGGTQQKHSAV